MEKPREITIESAFKPTSYQRKWVEDKSRFKIGLWARQTGKSTACALELVNDAIDHRTLWVILSRGKRQSQEVMAKVNQFVRAAGYAAGEMKETFFEDTKYTQLTVELTNGSRIIGLPANPDTARGFSGNVVLDEFAFHADSDAIWTALYPTITRGYKLRVISTPNGKQNKFYQLWTSENWSKHKITIVDAAAEIGVNVEELRAGMKDEMAWRQEFLCEFLDEATAWLTWDQIRACEDEKAGKWELQHGTLYGGWDVARWNDLSSWGAWEKVGDVLWMRKMRCFQREKFSTQIVEINSDIAKGIQRTCVDGGGIGEMPAEVLQDKWGEYRIENIKFTSENKAVLAAGIRDAFEDRRIRIPIDEDLRADLHSVRKTYTLTGKPRFEGETDDSHADRFWMTSLAVHAAGAKVGVGIAVL